VQFQWFKLKKGVLRRGIVGNKSEDIACDWRNCIMRSFTSDQIKQGEMR
jgi:hypothetical protein